MLVTVLVSYSHLLLRGWQLDFDLGSYESRLGHGELQLLPARLVDHAGDLQVAGVEELQMQKGNILVYRCTRSLFYKRQRCLLSANYV